MPVELTDEQVKTRLKETLEKLTNKGGKSKGAKHRREKEIFQKRAGRASARNGSTRQNS